MNLQLEKFQVIQQIINIQDSNLIQKINQLINQESVSAIKPMSLDEFYNRILASKMAYQEGRITSHQELKEEIKSWRNSH
jgi:hypothetical protein